MKISVRIASPDDAFAVNETYGYYIAHSLANFGEQNASAAERAQEIKTLLDTYPFFIAEDDSGQFLGFACAEPLGAWTQSRSMARTL